MARTSVHSCGARPGRRGGGHALRRHGISERRDLLRHRRRRQAPALRAPAAGLRAEPAGRSRSPRRSASGACMTVSLRRRAIARDPEGEPLSYVWRFGDGTKARTARRRRTTTTRRGASRRTLEVDRPLRRSSATARRSAVMVFVKKPPVALSDKRVLVAQARGRPLRRRAVDGEQVEDRAPRMGFRRRHGAGRGRERRPRLRQARHLQGHPHGDRRFRPPAATPPRRSSRSGSTRSRSPRPAPTSASRSTRRPCFDAGASTDSDGKIVDYQWDFGDGSKASGADGPPHLCQARDLHGDAGHPRRFGGRQQRRRATALTIIVNDPPVPEAGADKSGAIGEPLTFDASGSVDRDGRIIAYDWDFGDGSDGDRRRGHARLCQVGHLYGHS